MTLTILSSESRPSTFVRELQNDPSYGLASTSSNATAQVGTCGECGGRLIPVQSKGGKTWYRCEHIQHCGNILPACSSCGAGLPAHRDGSDELTCPSCAETFPGCPNCRQGCPIPRPGRFGVFLGCVRYPAFDGRGKPDGEPRSPDRGKWKSYPQKTGIIPSAWGNTLRRSNGTALSPPNSHHTDRGDRSAVQITIGKNSQNCASGFIAE